MRRWGTRGAHRALSLLGRSWSLEVLGTEHLRVAVARGAFVYTLWHRTLLPLLWWHRAQNITLLVSGHDDGGLVAEAALRMGYRVARGSSTRGGVSGALSLLRALQEGHPAAVTPDGPRGPAGVAKRGAVSAACRAGVPILPVAATASPAWRARSWDGLAVPLPFARVRVAYAAPWDPWSDGPDACIELGARIDGAVRMAELGA